MSVGFRRLGKKGKPNTSRSRRFSRPKPAININIYRVNISKGLGAHDAWTAPTPFHQNHRVWHVHIYIAKKNLPNFRRQFLVPASGLWRTFDLGRRVGSGYLVGPPYCRRLIVKAAHGSNTNLAGQVGSGDPRLDPIRENYKKTS